MRGPPAQGQLHLEIVVFQDTVGPHEEKHMGLGDEDSLERVHLGIGRRKRRASGHVYMRIKSRLICELGW